MGKPKKIAVRYIESNDKKSDREDDAKAAQEKLNATDGEGCAFC